ncbi:diguanylate cyclase [Novosphingobium aerophilum]|uniref:diguanylate cyclase n=1 Tax=Novosphingobium TaxID=165696 RepID=UPI002D76705F|nr:diguanylate cyclase [Novosphingobium sp. RL4]WRT94383.1 diguanylate cyclase [Novosphingobium sp. RL4]
MHFTMKSVSFVFIGLAAVASSGPAFARDIGGGGAVVNTALHIESQNGVSKGFALIRAGKPAQAVKMFDSVILASEQALTGDVRPRLCQSEAAEGSVAAGKAVIVSSAVCDAHFGKGFALVDLGRGDLAEAELRRATELAPDNAHFANEYAELFKSRREWQRSYDLFSHAWEIVDKDTKGDDASVAARALRGMGYNKIEMGQLDEAQKLFRQSLEYDPANAGAKSELDFIAQKKAIGA